MITYIQKLGEAALNIFEKLGRGHLFILHVLLGIPGLFWRFGLVIQQLYAVGVLSLLIIGVAGFFVGMHRILFN